MLVSKDCMDLKLAKTLQGGDDFIWVSGSDAVKLNGIGVDNHINLTITDNRACETVRYDHITNWPATGTMKQIPVMRDMGATGRRNFGVYSCVVADWSVTQIVELIESIAVDVPYNDCDGVPHAAGAMLPSCEQLVAAVAAVVTVSPTALPYTEQTELPTRIYGPRTALLGEPDGWFLIQGKHVPFWD